jgi:hypothetical protein
MQQRGPDQPPPRDLREDPPRARDERPASRGGPLLVTLAAIVMIVSPFLAWAGSDFSEPPTAKGDFDEPENFADGHLALLGGVVALIAGVVALLTRGIHIGSRIVAFLVGIGALVFAWFEYARLDSESISPEVGVYLLGAGGLLCVIGAALIRSDRPKRRPA